ncbi:MAG: hypothetical protein N3A72_09620 [bacterium]|nr:hypothetical protein [bacterium]
MLRDAICLNGEWQFQPDPGTLLYPPEPTRWSDTKIRIPSPWNVNAFFPEKGGDFRCYPSYPKEWEFAAAGWHRCEFVVPNRWKNSQIFLQFNGVHYYCEIYLNGTLIGNHEDGFIPFEIDITNHIKFEQTNELIVGVKSFVFFNRQSPIDAKTKYPYPTGSFWGMFASGIWLDVFIHAYPKIRIEDVYIQTSVRKKQIILSTTIINYTNELQTIQLRHKIKKWRSWQTTCTIKPYAKKNVAISLNWANPQLWHPEHPYLYYLDTEIKSHTDSTAKTTSSLSHPLLDKVTTRFGFREFWIDKSRFILNGSPIKLRGDAWHYLGIAYQNPNYARLWYQLAKQSNINHIRLHAQIYPQFYLDLADELGILITDETAIWASHCAFHYNPDFWRRAKDHVTALVKRDRNHPSVVIWSIENEALAAYTFVQDDAVKNANDLSERFYELVKEVKKIDATRPISADGSFDLCGKAEIYNIHYPPLPRLKNTIKNKPIAVGELGSMYYSTPDEVSLLHGEKTYLSFKERLKAIAKEQKRMIYFVREWAELVTPFNIVWYSLEPLPFSGEKISYTQLNTAGPKPERIGPYCATLNPGYDKQLPKWKPNVLYFTLKKLLTPIRVFIKEQEKSYFSDSPVRLNLTIHNDSYDTKNIILNWKIQIEPEKRNVAYGHKSFKLQPATKQYYQIKFSTPHVTQRTAVTLEIQVKSKSRKRTSDIIFQDKYRIFCLPRLSPAIERFKSCRQTMRYTRTIYDNLILISPRTKLSDDEIYHLKSLVYNGSRVICLDNNEDFINKLGYTSFEPGKYDRAFIQLPRHAILNNIRQSDIQFWGSDECIAYSHFANFPRGNFRPLINLGNGKPVLIELFAGKGAYYLTTLSLSKNIRKEPGAELIYRNLVEYARQPLNHQFTATILLGETRKTLKLFLDYLGVEYHHYTKLTNPTTSTIIIDGSQTFDVKHINYIRNFIRNGGIVIIFGLNPNTLKSFYPIFPFPIQVIQHDIEHLVKTKPDQLLSGIHSADLYWIERNHKNPIIQYGIETNQNKKCDILLGAPQLDWRKWNWEAEPIKTAAIHKSELTKPKPANGLVRFRIGKGQIIINQLCFEQTNLIKSGKVMSLLFTNLGVRLNPEKANQFASNLQMKSKDDDNRCILLLNPSG